MNDDGMYRLYDLVGEYIQYSLGSEASELGVIDAKIYENGLVAMTSNVTLFEVKGWNGGKVMQLATTGMLNHCAHSVDRLTPTFQIGLTQPPHYWALIEPDQTISRHVEVLMAEENSIYTADNLECVDQVRAYCQSDCGKSRSRPILIRLTSLCNYIAPIKRSFLPYRSHSKWQKPSFIHRVRASLGRFFRLSKQLRRTRYVFRKLRRSKTDGLVWK